MFAPSRRAVSSAFANPAFDLNVLTPITAVFSVRERPFRHVNS